MCAVAGILGFDGCEDPSTQLTAMTSAMTHRGPDAKGAWISRDEQIALGHCRLSIIDLTSAGAQPMTSIDGRWTMAFNGEIYNYRAIRERLEVSVGAIRWRGHSDTEVLLESFARSGVQATLDLVDGMFAIALFDNKNQRLTLIRDAFGEKPLYYGLVNGRLVFASELRAIEALPEFEPKIDIDALGSYFKYSYVPSPATIWRNVFKLPAAHMLTVSVADLAGGRELRPECWWDAVGDALRAHSSPFKGSFEEAKDVASELLLASIGRRLISDVPLGAFLSGGIDSSMAVALMQATASRSIKTFSIGIDEPGYDEAPAASQVAKHLGTDHAELVLTPEEVQSAVPDIARVHDEPFADSSQVPTWLVSRMAKQDVTVAISGDGGDEIFGGYNRYFRGPRLWSRAARLPSSVRKMFAGAVGAIPPALVNQIVRASGNLAPAELRSGGAGEKVQKLARIMGAPNILAFHDSLLSTNTDHGFVINDAAEAITIPDRIDTRLQNLAFAERAMMLDTENYLTDDVLTKVDRASMANSLETRTPYLERDLFRFAWSLPPELRAGRSEGKVLLREMLYDRIPRHLVDRPKAGFSFPVGRWLRGGLRPWAEESLSRQSLERSGLLNADSIRKLWREHSSGRRNNESILWSVLMFNSWYENAACRHSINI